MKCSDDSQSFVIITLFIYLLYYDHMLISIQMYRTQGLVVAIKICCRLLCFESFDYCHINYSDIYKVSKMIFIFLNIHILLQYFQLFVFALILFPFWLLLLLLLFHFDYGYIRVHLVHD